MGVKKIRQEVLVPSMVIRNQGSEIGFERGGQPGWKDLIGVVVPKTTGANTPTLGAWRGGNTRAFSFAAGDKIDFVFHMPHDWAPGTDLFIHTHWGHNGTDISGSLVVNYYATFAKGFSQEAFVAELNPTLTVSSLSITNTPQYEHRVDEIQLSTSGGSATQLDTDTLEVDGLVIVQGVTTTIPTITGGSPNQPFIFTIDIHYQSFSPGTTKNKAPDFYGQ